MVSAIVSYVEKENSTLKDIFLIDVRPAMVKCILDELEQKSDLKSVSVSHMASNSGSDLVKSVSEDVVEKDGDCSICMDSLDEPRRLVPCGHVFCRGCLESAFSHKPVCPVCGHHYDTVKGTQPEWAEMTVDKDDRPLPGYGGSRTLVIDYNVPSGIQTDQHPKPGEWYTGTGRRAYLPNTREGQEVLALLQKAFKQKLIFTVGRSSTTGKENAVTWNDIHHKTRREGGPQKFGYPDPTYFQRVKEELAAKGVTECD